MNIEHGYQEKILVFFDVLGFKALVKEYRNEPEKIEEILRTMHLISQTSYPSEFITFSDTVINILEVKNPLKEYGQTFSDYLQVIISDIASIQVNMFDLFGVLVRGSIVIGDIKYNNEKNILFGPALIDAYDLESNYSVYPRFILDTNIVKLIKEDIGKLDVSIDTDGFYYVDPFTYFVKTEHEKKTLTSIKEKIKNKIKEMENAKNPKLAVLSKYHWFLNKIIEIEQMNLKKTISK